ncbi:S8 family serine peptidase [Amycolatopsis solani]|uniref:S8 family serine peptidase n=1 Tax=Amycolatopsis solani TaxID=3028615 RepID=UPI00296F7FD0|nr:S8 family serine peptidase [Amycolatopsis sp. MEP2-6]
MSLSASRTRGRRLVLAVLVAAGSLGALPAATAAAAAPPPAAHQKIAQELLDRIAGARSGPGTRFEAVVVLKDRGLAPSSPDAARRTLTDSAKAMQAPVTDLVGARRDQVVNTFWLKNMVLVRATPATLDAVAALPLVDRVIPNFTLKTPTEPQRKQAKAEAETAVAWGVSKIGADRVQADGTTGAGVRVAILDTGIDTQHPDLAGKLVSADPANPEHPGGWLEFAADGSPVHSTPHDSSYHGTHVAGTIAGGHSSGTQIGVAPGAELMAGLVIPGGSGTLTQVIAGMQWAIAPYDADGKPAGKPANVVSMSLGEEGYSSEMVEPARNIYLAGAFPAFAIGNECVPGGSAAPGNVFESTGVGATDDGDNVPDFSCGGVVRKKDWADAPASWPDSYVVPDLSAPGVDVLSSLPGGEYGLLSGTSMATPHVSGTVALMLHANPKLTPDDTLEILTGTSFFDDRYGARPNTRFGAGRIDAAAAVAEARLASGITGTVTAGKDPLAKTTITVAATGRSYTSDADGHFKIRVPAGTYDLTLSRFGYHDQRVRVAVATGKQTALRVTLKPTPRGTISGRVAYGPTGSTVPGATVRVLDVLDELTAVSDGTGHYTVQNVPEGSYRVAASAAGISATAPRQVVVTGGHRPATADFALPRPPATQLVSVTRDGGQIRDHTFWPAMSGDAGVIAFASASGELVPGDTNDDMDIFARDGRTGAIERISVASDGTGANAWSISPTVSPDGRYVGFLSGATNLVPGEGTGIPGSFARDRRTGTTELVSVSSEEKPADGLSGQPVFSTDGRYAVFVSQATNLVPGDANGKQDIFLRDRVAGTTELVSAGLGGAGADGDSLEPSVSGDGRFVAFESGAENLVAGGGNAHRDVFVRDRKTGTTEVIPAPGGAEATQPSLSADGRKVAYAVSPADGPSQVYVYDRQGRTTTLVSQAATGTGGADSYTASPRISGDGTAVAFFSFAGNLVPGDGGGASDVFVRDLRTAKTDKVSGALGGQEGDSYSDFPAISTDGKYVAFESEAANLVEDDTNGRSDIFVRDRAPGPAPRFALSDLRTEDAHGRSPAQISASVKDVGELAGSYQAVLWVDGVVTAERPVPVRPGQTACVTFELPGLARGTHTVRLGPLTGSVTVRR